MELDPGMEWLGGNTGDFPYRQAFCPICGYLLLKLDDRLGKDYDIHLDDVVEYGRGQPHWLKNLVYMTIEPGSQSGYNFYHDEKELKDEDIHVGASRYIIRPTTRLVVVNDQGPSDSEVRPARQYTMHAACVRILRKTFSQRANRAINSMSDLYRALETQCWVETDYLGPRGNIFDEVYGITSMSWSHKYFGASHCHTGYGTPSGFMYEENPEQIDGLTEYILTQLQPLRKPQATDLLRDRIAALPQELEDMVLDQITWPMADNPSLEPTRCGTPEFWLQALLTGQALPWLWDLERGACVAHHTTKPDPSKGEDWDWELLVRKLAQTNIFDDGQPMKNAPNGLRNRRRIWRCCNELVPGMFDRQNQPAQDWSKKYPDLTPEGERVKAPPSSMFLQRNESEPVARKKESLRHRLMGRIRGDKYY